MKYTQLLGRTAASFVLAVMVILGISEQGKASSTTNSLIGNASTTSTINQALALELQETLDRSLGDIPGASFAIVSPRGAWFGVSGSSNLETETALVVEDRFQIGSITKMFVATTVLQLAEEGKLSLEDTLENWLPSEIVAQIPNYERITIRQLLNHTSGIYDYLDPLFAQAQTNPLLFLRQWQPEQLVSFIYGQQSYFEPGESWQYSNTNYILLGMIVEAVTNSSINSEIRSRIIDPLGLDNTFFAQEEEIPGGFVSGYWDFDGDGSLNDISIANMSWAWAAGAMVSNPFDLVRFIEALLINDELLKPETKEQMLDFVKPIVSDNYAAYGLGVGTLESPNRLWYGQRGLTLGYRSNLFYSPIEDLIFVELINTRTDRNISNPIFRVWRAGTQDPVPSISVPEPGVIPGLLIVMGTGLLIRRKGCS